MKVCTKCKKELDIALFRKDSSKKDGLYSSCNDCFRKRMGITKRHYNKWHIGTDGYVHKGNLRQHRYIMEQELGRKLNFNEHVHHINGVKHDNRLENLVVLSSNEHHRVHSGRIKTGVVKVCTACGKQRYYAPSTLRHCISESQYRCYRCYREVRYKRTQKNQ